MIIDQPSMRKNGNKKGDAASGITLRNTAEP
jgi:hypothetical protein